MGLGKWFLVLAAGGIGAGVVVAGMTTGKIQKYPDSYALSDGQRSRAEDREMDDARGYALPDGAMDEADGFAEEDGFGPPRGRMVILDGSGWDDRAPPPRWIDQDEDEAGEEPAFVSPPAPFQNREQRLYQPSPRSYLPQQAAPATPPRPTAPPRDSGADAAAASAARAAGAAADVLAAEREGA
jgi:hypothetical protein